MIPFTSEKKLKSLISSLGAQNDGSMPGILAIGPQLHEEIPNVGVILWTKPFDQLEMLKEALSSVATAQIVVCNENVRFNGTSCIEELAAVLQRCEVGASSAKLLYNDGLVQHAGLALSDDSHLMPINQNFTARMGGGYLGMAECSCDYPSISSSCFCVRKSDLASALTATAQIESPEALMTRLAVQQQSKGKLLVVLPQAMARISIAPQQVGESIPVNCTGLTAEMLYNPAVTYSRGYPQLSVPKNEKRELGEHMVRIALRKLRRK